MARSRSARLGRLIFSLVFLAGVEAQSQSPDSAIAASSPAQTASSASSTAPPSSATTSASGASTSVDVPLSMWSGAVSLLSSYYPSTSLTDVRTLTWPATVVIDGSTYSVHPGPTGTPTSSLSNNEPTSGASSNNSNPNDRSDKTLGIALGVALGVVALALVVFMMWCLRRRHQKHGRWTPFSRDPTPTDDEVAGWRTPQMASMAAVPEPIRPSNAWIDRHNRVNGQHLPPPEALHPAYATRPTPSSTPSSSENPFYTPMEQAEMAAAPHYPGHERYPAELDTEAGYKGGYRAELDSDSASNSHHRQSTDRPPTPFSPLAMMGLGAGPKRENPFASPEDHEADEAADLVSPIVPARHPERRHSPLVHYPSWDEVSEFDFATSGSGSGTGGDRSLRHRSFESDGGDGWRAPRRESVIGRTELA